MTCHKSYIDGPDGQIHVREWACGHSAKPPLLCLHPAPWSGLYFGEVAPLLCHNRPVIALDYPGYGGSDPIAGRAPTIQDYAQAARAVITQLCADGPVDLLGFHTGCLVGVELAQLAPTLVGRLILADIPYFKAHERKAMLAAQATDEPITQDLSSLESMWHFSVSKRLDDMPLARAYQLFLEQARAGNARAAAFEAAFTYDCETRFGSLIHESWIMATTSMLRAATLNAVRDMPHAQLVDLPEIAGSVFDAHAVQMAREIDALY